MRTLAGLLEDPEFVEVGDECDALNVREFANTSTDVQGVNPASLPSGFDFEAVSGYVMVWVGLHLPATTGGVPARVLLFSEPNQIDGTCP